MKLKRLLLLLPLLALTACNDTTTSYRWLGLLKQGSSICHHVKCYSISYQTGGAIKAKTSYGEITLNNVQYVIFDDSCGSCPLCKDTHKNNWD